ncbi:hypothetical protein G6F65_021416 [Rhizopus arrhizus]|nr:hypothetical protein G6F65_021416 [Rhizopus arrhizus]
MAIHHDEAAVDDHLRHVAPAAADHQRLDRVDHLAVAVVREVEHDDVGLGAHRQPAQVGPAQGIGAADRGGVRANDSSVAPWRPDTNGQCTMLAPASRMISMSRPGRCMWREPDT